MKGCFLSVVFAMLVIAGLMELGINVPWPYADERNAETRAEAYLLEREPSVVCRAELPALRRRLHGTSDLRSCARRIVRSRSVEVELADPIELGHDRQLAVKSGSSLAGAEVLMRKLDGDWRVASLDPRLKARKFGR